MPDRVVDRLLIQEVLHRYAWALDGGDPGVLADCFTHDVRAEYAGEQLAPGRQAILDYTGARMEAVEVTTHAVSNVVIRFDDGAEADVDSIAMVALREVVDGQERVRLRGIQYADHFRCEEGRWRIAARRHLPLWEAEMPSTGMLPHELVPAAGAVARR